MIWNERSQLIETSDSRYTVLYRYGADGQRRYLDPQKSRQLSTDPAIRKQEKLMTTWQRYIFTSFGIPIFSFLVFFTLAQMDHMDAGVIVAACGVMIGGIISFFIKCPKCKTPLCAGALFFSKHYNGKIIPPERCVNCYHDLNPQ